MAKHPPNTPAGEAERVARAQDIDTTQNRVSNASDHDRALVEAAGLDQDLPKAGESLSLDEQREKFGNAQDEINALEARIRLLRQLAPGGPEYPKVKYRAVEAAKVTPPLESRTVNSRDEEDALEGDWKSTPGEIEGVEIPPLPVEAPAVAKVDTPDTRALDDIQAERQQSSRGGGGKRAGT